MRNVDTGSREHDLTGDFMISRRTSVVVHSVNAVSDDVVVCCTGGGARLAVD